MIFVGKKYFRYCFKMACKFHKSGASDDTEFSANFLNVNTINLNENRYGFI